MDDKGLWYKQMVGSKERVFFTPDVLQLCS
jgi:hypothetical protein